MELATNRPASYQGFGLISLGAYALASLMSLFSLNSVLPRNIGSLLVVACLTIALVAAEVWAVLYWRLTKSQASFLALVLLSIIVIFNFLSLLPQFSNLLNRLLG